MADAEDAYCGLLRLIAAYCGRWPMPKTAVPGIKPLRRSVRDSDIGCRLRCKRTANKQTAGASTASGPLIATYCGLLRLIATFSTASRVRTFTVGGGGGGGGAAPNLPILATQPCCGLLRLLQRIAHIVRALRFRRRGRRRLRATSRRRGDPADCGLLRLIVAYCGLLRLIAA